MLRVNEPKPALNHFLCKAKIRTLGLGTEVNSLAIGAAQIKTIN
jgi:hypothetical protein